MLLALFMVESVWAVPPRVSTPRPTDGGPSGRTSYDDSMESPPDQRRRAPRIHPLEIPFVWFGIQFIEFAIVFLLISTFVPDDWPVVVPITLFFGLMVGISVANYRIRRRFIPR